LSLEETPLATWQYAGVSYAVAAQSAEDGPLLILIAALGPGKRSRTAHQRRPNDERELANQMVKWNGLTDAARTREAELLLSRR
jgi:hypothetical protein